MENASDNERSARRPTDPPTAPAKVAMLCDLFSEDDLDDITAMMIMWGSKQQGCGCSSEICRCLEREGWAGREGKTHERV